MGGMDLGMLPLVFLLLRRADMQQRQHLLPDAEDTGSREHSGNPTLFPQGRVY